MPSTVTSRIAAAILFAISTTAAASGSEKPPRFLTVPVLGLRLPLARINVETFPEEIRVKCGQIEDEYRTSRLWIFGRAQDGAKTYYILTGYSTRRSAEPGQRRYEYWNDGVVFAVQGEKCGGDGAEETFDVRDPDAENDGNVSIPVLKVLAVDLAARTVKAFGGADRLRAEIKNQRINFNKLSPELQAAFSPYFGQ